MWKPLNEVQQCPHCGQAIDVTLEARNLLNLLTDGAPHREVYRAHDGTWWATYGGGPYSRAAVLHLRSQGAIQSVYSNCPEDAFHVGKTLDVDRTTAARNENGKDAPRIYLGDA